MTKIVHFRDIVIYENYITNVNEIIDLLETKYSNRFLDRSLKEATSAEEDINGGDILIVESHTDLYKTIFKTIEKQIVEYYPDEVDIYRYQYGNYLPPHQDATVTPKMVTDLTFLQSEKNHFKIYTEEHRNGYFIDENPGRRVIIAPDMKHEITPMEKNETTRYTLVMTWYNDKPTKPWWKKR